MKLIPIVLFIFTSFHTLAQTTLQEANYNGRNGRSGGNGSMRFAIRLFHMSKRGGNGKPGKPGPTLQVNVSAVPTGDSTILLVTINKAGDNKTKQFYVNPRYGKLSISANGGKGGDGGDGQDGDEPTEKHPYGFSGGDGGNAADGGDGGTINVTFDATAMDYVKCDCIIYHNDGGIGGQRGKGGSASGNNPDGNEGMDGGNGSSNPRIFIKDKKGTVLWIARSFNPYSR